MTIMTDQGYSVPTIPQDLRREETILQIADSLEYLEKVANDVFTRISKRVAENRTKLQKVNDRVNLAQARVDKLKGSNKATKVFASSKYPAESEQQNYETMFSSTDGIKATKRKHYKVQSKHPALDEHVLREKLQFFNVHLNTKSRKEADNMGEGLGGLPRYVPSISSLLLFNTSENPYKKYVMLDPLGVVTKTRAAMTEGASGPADAPTTITHNEELQQQQQENYFYVPGMGNVPEIAVPSSLPNLQGVAHDVSFSADQGPSIAPSVLTTAIPDLPDIAPEVDAIPSGPAAIATGAPDTSAAAPPPPPPPPPPSGPPPPPPPGPPPPPSPAAPPPPPPPPPPPGPSEEGGGAAAPAEVPAAEASGGGGGDSRSTLMDAIRKAGGAKKAKLRSGQELKMESKKKKQEEKEKGSAPTAGGGGGGNLMGDLFAKLSMRRKGISGGGKGGGEKSEGSSGGGGSAMDKISSMIPSPPKPATDDHGDDDDGDDDWVDD